jgi:acetyl esterase/lipase
MSWAFLFVSLIGAWFTYNAHVPHRHGRVFTVPSFFAGWLTDELAAHHVAWQAAATVAFVLAGALAQWPGWAALAITFASWAGLLALIPIHRRGKRVIEAALVEGLGLDYRSRIAAGSRRRLLGPEPRGRLALPFRLSDPEVAITRSVEYAPDAGTRHRLDVYAPRAGARDAPVLLQIHGGAWVVGHRRNQALPLMLHLASRGWICVAANYRLSPAATFPDHIVDVKLAIKWIREHIAEYGGDPDFVAATGGSAGGHLSALAALTANDPEYQPGIEEVDTSLRACVPFYGAYDWTNRFNYWPNDGMIRFLERYVVKRPFSEAPELYDRASPMGRVNADAPAFFVIHGTHDSLVPVEEAARFAARLREVSRSPVVYAELPGAQHAFDVFYSRRSLYTVRAVHRFLAFVHSCARARPGTEAADAEPVAASRSTGPRPSA